MKPKYTNPKMIPYVCKHIVHAFGIAMRKRIPGKKVQGMNLNNQGDIKSRIKNTTPNIVWYGDNTISEREPAYGVDPASK
jgi:hypothetical protein